MRSARALADTRGSAVVEMALVMPLLLLIMFGSVELGNYFMAEHKLVKAVRDGARFAARQSFSNYSTCSSTSANVPTPGVSNSVYENTKLVVRKGSLDSSTTDLLPNWTSATFGATVQCTNAIGSYTPGGIYSGNNFASANNAGWITVTVQIPYRPVLQAFGFRGTGALLNASQQAAVTGL